jgi:uncharacterized protein YdhG (YjbR/CyaY superfamily)
MNQSHSCTVRQETIEAYIEVQQEVYRPTLHALHQCILTSMGEVEERMSWGMPTYYKEGNLLHFSVHVHHVTLHVGQEVLTHFSARLEGYTTGKGSIQLPFAKDLDLELVADIARFVYEQTL